MSAADVLFVYRKLEDIGVEIWLDGGWAVDALLGKQTRPHGDLDIAIRQVDVDDARGVLEAQRYREIKRDSPWNFVMGDGYGHEIDFHAFVLGADGRVVDGIKYPDGSLTGAGTIDGYAVQCIAPEHLVRFHTGYPLRDGDFADVSALCEHFGIALPNEYSLTTQDPSRVEARITKWSVDHDFVRAAILTSTRANPSAKLDSFSDMDVILVVTDIAPLFRDRTWLSDLGNVLVVYRDPIGLELGVERFRYITQYADGTKIDFTLWPIELLRRVSQEAALPDELDVGYRVLLDKDHLTTGLRPPTYRAHIPQRPTEAQYQDLIAEFLHEATYVAKHLARGDLMPAKYNLDHEMKQVNLRMMLEWYVEIDEDWSWRPGAYGKRLRGKLARDLWAELEATYVGAGAEENWHALFQTVALFRRIALRVGEHLGYPYPRDLDDRVVMYLQRVQAGTSS